MHYVKKNILFILLLSALIACNENKSIDNTSAQKNISGIWVREEYMQDLKQTYNLHKTEAKYGAYIQFSISDASKNDTLTAFLSDAHGMTPYEINICLNKKDAELGYFALFVGIENKAGYVKLKENSLIFTEKLKNNQKTYIYSRVMSVENNDLEDLIGVNKFNNSILKGKYAVQDANNQQLPMIELLEDGKVVGFENFTDYLWLVHENNPNEDLLLFKQGNDYKYYFAEIEKEYIKLYALAGTPLKENITEGIPKRGKLVYRLKKQNL